MRFGSLHFNLAQEKQDLSTFNSLHPIFIFSNLSLDFDGNSSFDKASMKILKNYFD
jgi:hypothetical protein